MSGDTTPVGSLEQRQCLDTDSAGDSFDRPEGEFELVSFETADGRSELITVASRVELWIDGQLVDGAEGWWDEIEAMLAADESKFPLMSRVDPYGVVQFAQGELPALGDEIRSFLGGAPARLKPFLERIVTLCATDGEGASTVLRVLGD